MASSSGVPETLQAEADDLLQQARDRRKMEEKKKKRRSKSADRWRRRLQSALVTAEQLPTASASVPRQVQLPAAANLVASSKNRTIVVPHITSDQDVVIKEREHKKKAATICFQDVEEKFGEQNFRVLSEMRILAKIRVVILDSVEYVEILVKFEAKFDFRV